MAPVLGPLPPATHVGDADPTPGCLVQPRSVLVIMSIWRVNQRKSHALIWTMNQIKDLSASLSVSPSVTLLIDR